MLRNDKIVYCPPPFEEIQHEVTKSSEDGKPLQTSFHSDVALMMMIDKMSFSAKQIETLKQQLQPMIDKSNYRQEFEDAFGALTDDELIQSCPSRYIQTASEKTAYLKELSEQHKAEVEKSAKAKKDNEEKQKLLDEEKEFRESISKLFK